MLVVGHPVVAGPQAGLVVDHPAVAGPQAVLVVDHPAVALLLPVKGLHPVEGPPDL